MPTVTKGQSKAPPGSRWGIVFFLFAFATLALGAWFWSAAKNGSGVSADGGIAVKSSLHLDTFVLNLADRDQRSYLRVGIDLGLDRETAKGVGAAAVGQVRDTILGVLAQAKVEDLLTAEGKAKLKQNLLRGLQERVPGLGVQEVYLTEFLIQR